MRIRGRHIGLFLVAANAVLSAITVWSNDPENDTPPIMAAMMMVLGLAFLGLYLLTRFLLSRPHKEQRLRKEPRGFQVLPSNPSGDV